MKKTSSSTPSFLEAGFVIAITFGWYIVVSLGAVARGFPTSATLSNASLTSIIIAECIFASVALIFLHRRGHSLKELAASPTWSGCLHGALLYGATLFAWFFIAYAFPRSQLDAQPISEILANGKPSLPFVIALSVVNGLYEETFLLGYLVRSYAVTNSSLAIGLSTLVRLLYHMYQGPIGALYVTVFGLVLSCYYWRTRRLWPAVFAHILADAIALA